MRWVWLLACCSFAQHPAAQLTKEDILLGRVRYRTAQTLKSLPNYTCTQTIERLQRRAPAKRFELLDMVRLEVALVDGGELYKWPGAGHFQARDLREMVPNGAFGTGQFAGYAHAVFISGAARYTYAGEEFRGARRLVKWDYVVPVNLSSFQIRVPPNEAVVGFHGSFWADPDSLDLMRLEVHADDIPVELRLSESITSVEYQRVEIGTGAFLLPSVSELTMIDANGGASLNRARFEGCRQYSGQSVVTFDDPVEDKTVSPEPARIIDSPAGVSLELALDTTLRDKSTAVGDPVTFVLKKDAKSGHSLIAPKGALAHGRVVFMRRQNIGRYSGFIIGLDLTELEYGNSRVRLAARLEMVPNGAASTAAGPWNAQMFVLRDDVLAQYVQDRQAAPQGALFKPGYSLLLDKGFRMYWRTVAFEPEGKK
jgi:hypothetical protein